MSYNNGPKIVTNGLVLYLDAANNRSIVSGSTVWTDLTNTSRTGSLVNGPTFNSLNGGSIVFDGTNDRVLLPAVIDTNSSFTLEFWAMRTSDLGASTLISGNGPNSYFVIRMGPASVSLVKSFVAELGNFGAVSATTVNTINHIVVTRSGTTYTGYTNGIFRGTLTINQTYATAAPALAIYDAGNNEPFPGRIYKFAYYNRALSESEVRQNYNASKGRFGL